MNALSCVQEVSTAEGSRVDEESRNGIELERFRNTLIEKALSEAGAAKGVAELAQGHSQDTAERVKVVETDIAAIKTSIAAIERALSSRAWQQLIYTLCAITWLGVGAKLLVDLATGAR